MVFIQNWKEGKLYLALIIILAVAVNFITKGLVSCPGEIVKVLTVKPWMLRDLSLMFFKKANVVIVHFWLSK